MKHIKPFFTNNYIKEFKKKKKKKRENISSNISK